MYQDIHNRLFYSCNNTPSADSYRDLERRFGIHLQQQDIIQNQILRALEPLGKEVLRCCSPEQIQAIYKAIDCHEQDLDKDCFQEGTREHERLQYVWKA